MSEDSVNIILGAIGEIRKEFAEFRTMLSDKYVTQEVHALTVERVRKLESILAWVASLIIGAVVVSLLALVIIHKP